MQSGPRGADGPSRDDGQRPAVDGPDPRAGPVKRVDRGAALRLALVTGAGGVVLALLGALLDTSTGSSAPVVAVRAVLVTVLLGLAVRVVLAGSPERVRVPTALAGLLLGHLLTLAWTAGAAPVARLLTDRGAVAVLLELAGWLVVGVLATRFVPAPTQAPGDC